MNLRGLIQSRAHLGAPLALLQGLAKKVAPLRPVARLANRLLARHTDVRARAFDTEHGTDTFGRVTLRELGVDDSAYGGWMYGPICQDFFDEIARAIPTREAFTFLDVGMGKGLAVMRAREHGFARLMGIEMSADLCAVAERNFAAYARSTGRSLQVEVVCGDFMATELPVESTVLFLNNPFPAAVASLALGHIEASLKRHPRPAVVAWRRMPTPTRELLDRSSVLSLRLATPYWDVYATRH